MSKMKKWLNNWFKESVEFYGSMFRYGIYYRQDRGRTQTMNRTENQKKQGIMK